jgi:hypothetical protein
MTLLGNEWWWRSFISKKAAALAAAACRRRLLHTMMRFGSEKQLKPRGPEALQCHLCSSRVNKANQGTRLRVVYSIGFVRNRISVVIANF